jgi:hypothetical protein
MHTSIFMVIAAKTGVPLNLVLHLARSCHIQLLSNKKSPREKPVGVVAIIRL